MRSIRNLLFALGLALPAGGPLVLAADDRAQAVDRGEQAVQGLLQRVLHDDARHFQTAFIAKEGGRDVFELERVGGKIVLRGNDGVSVASALNYYLEHYAHCDITWNGTNLKLPHPLPDVPEKVHRTSPYRFRYYFNYCTFNYSMSWWDWDRWQWEIDWMALNGINMPLALTGQNAVLRRVYRDMGFTDSDLGGFFSGPAYFAWFWMGNLDGWGGPLPVDSMARQESLQKRILQRERELGMTPVLPAFAGHVPAAFKDRFPNAKLKRTNWDAGFSDVYLLDPGDPAFVDVGRRVISEEIRTFGTDHLYSADTFNENRPPTNDPAFLAGISRRVSQSMTAVDPEAVWVMQGWLFANDRAFWQPAQIKALLDGVPNDRMVILDLWSESSPVWNRTEAFYGKPWIWCMLHNFGGRACLFGRMDRIANDPAGTLHDPAAGRMAGIGLTPEAIGQNPVVYELMLENVWRDRPIDLERWLREYALRRYGRENGHAANAWRTLARTAYAGRLQRGSESIITGRPTLDESTVFTATALGYRAKDLLPAWDELIAAADALGNSDGFRYDLVDVTRQVLANYGNTLQRGFAKAYRADDLASFQDCSRRFLALIDDMDRLLATRGECLLGKWLADARSCGSSAEERDLFERNARDQITLWGGPNCKLHEYAAKQWSGMLKGFYGPRWGQFLGQMETAMRRRQQFDADAFERGIKAWEWRWVNGRETYPAVPAGDAVTVAKELYAKYHSLIGAAPPP